MQSTVNVDKDHEVTTLIQLLKQKFGHIQEVNDQVLDALILQRQIDAFDERADRVNVLTLHASKGLEFPVVFIPACEEGILPHYMPGQKIDLEEERRLLYVGMTRAQHHLYLSSAKKRMLQGQNHEREPSRFLNSISEALIERQQRRIVRKSKNNQLTLF